MEELGDKQIGRILISAEQIEQTIQRLADEISVCFSPGDNVLALIVLEGAKYFAGDLLTHIRFPIEAEHLKASSYHGGMRSAGHVDLKEPQALRRKIKDRNILLIDDIYDTGLTLAKVLDWLKACGPKSVRTCVLLEKEIPHQKQISIDFLGLTIEDVFVVGCGLDYEGRYRELPYIAGLAT